MALHKRHSSFTTSEHARLKNARCELVPSGPPQQDYLRLRPSLQVGAAHSATSTCWVSHLPSLRHMHALCRNSCAACCEAESCATQHLLGARANMHAVLPASALLHMCALKRNYQYSHTPGRVLRTLQMHIFSRVRACFPLACKHLRQHQHGMILELAHMNGVQNHQAIHTWIIQLHHSMNDCLLVASRMQLVYVRLQERSHLYTDPFMDSQSMGIESTPTCAARYEIRCQRRGLHVLIPPCQNGRIRRLLCSMRPSDYPFCTLFLKLSGRLLLPVHDLIWCRQVQERNLCGNGFLIKSFMLCHVSSLVHHWTSGSMPAPDAHLQLHQARPATTAA